MYRTPPEALNTSKENQVGQNRVRVLSVGNSRRAAVRVMCGSTLNMVNTDTQQQLNPDPLQPQEQPDLGKYRSCLHMGYV